MLTIYAQTIFRASGFWADGLYGDNFFLKDPAPLAARQSVLRRFVASNGPSIFRKVGRWNGDKSVSFSPSRALRQYSQAFAQSRRSRKKVEMLFAHLKRILRLSRLQFLFWAHRYTTAMFSPST
jgi:hypothetical protein